MNKTIVIFIVYFFLNPTLFASEPDESGIGGTGAGMPDMNDLIFNRPDVPEVSDIPDIPNIEENSVPDIDLPADLGASTDFSKEGSVPTMPEN